MNTRVLFCGDVHLGRRPKALPKGLENDAGLSPRNLGPKAALARAVAEACRLHVDAFVFAGDVVDEDNRFFEAYGPLRENVEQLVAAGIQVFGVCGNHDVETLPRLAREIRGFKLLGANGQWEDAIIAGRSGPQVALRGWSFPTRHVVHSPFLSERPKAPGGVSALLGVLHGELDVKDSLYAPFTRRELEAEREVRGWFLGHIHKPSLDASSERPIGYLGSLCGLDRSETGEHGPWLVEVTEAGALRIEQLPLAPLVWERVVLNASNWRDRANFESALMSAMATIRARVQTHTCAPRAIGVSLVLEGALAQATQLRAQFESSEFVEELAFDDDRMLSFIADIEDRTHEPIDLALRALSEDPAGLVARRILALAEKDSAGAQALILKARRALQEETRRREFIADLDPVEFTDEALRERLTRAAWRALETLESTREEQRT